MEHDFFEIYPRYFNANATKEMGRRVSKELAIPNPTLKQIAAAVKSAYPNTEITEEAEKRYPRSAVEDHDIGRLKIKKIEGTTKEKALRAIGQALAAEHNKQKPVAPQVVSKAGKSGKKK